MKEFTKIDQGFMQSRQKLRDLLFIGPPRSVWVDLLVLVYMEIFVLTDTVSACAVCACILYVNRGVVNKEDG